MEGSYNNLHPEGMHEFGSDFISKVCIDATNAPGTEPIETSSCKCTEDSTASTCSIRYQDEALNTSSYEDDDCSIHSVISTDSNKSMDSTKMLLKQAHARMHRQSIYEEVQHLRTLVSGRETHSKLLERQNSNIVAKYQELESAYTAALKQIHQYKLNEQRIKEEQAQRELEYMNQINEVCRDHDAKEQDYMGQIIELQNRLNEMEIGKRKKSLEKEGREVCDAVSDLETALRISELNDCDEENSDDCSIDYI